MDIAEIINAVKAILQTEIDVNSQEAKEYLSDLRERILHLTDGNALGELSFKEVGKRLVEEKENAEAFLIAITGSLQASGAGIINSIVGYLITALLQKATGTAFGSSTT